MTGHAQLCRMIANPGNGIASVGRGLAESGSVPLHPILGDHREHSCAGEVFGLADELIERRTVESSTVKEHDGRRRCRRWLEQMEVQHPCRGLLVLDHLVRAQFCRRPTIRLVAE